MSAAVVLLLLLAGLSEAVGRILPLVARRPTVSRAPVVGMLITGTFVDGTVIGLWPVSAVGLVALLFPASGISADAGWSPVLLAPLVFSAVLAFPLLGPFLHFVLFVAVGAGLSSTIATAMDVGWWAAAGCVGVAGLVLALTVEGVRRLVVAVTLRQAPAVTA